MCGIVYVKRFDNKPAAKQALKRYTKQKSRGEDGYAYVAVKQSGNVSKVSRFQFEHEMKESLEHTQYNNVLLHHRFPTSTPNVPEATHPIVVKHQELEHDYYVVHNGVIHNEDDLKDKHEKLGYKYTTEIMQSYKASASGKVYTGRAAFNDSEAFAIELARAIEGKQPLVRAQGAIAYIALQTTKQGAAVALYYGTNGKNPLTITEHKDFLVIASEGGKAIDAHKHYRYDLISRETTYYPAIKLDGHDEKVVGHVGYGGGYDWDEGKPFTRPKRIKTHFVGNDATMTFAELEDALDQVESELEVAKEEASYALVEGVEEEIEIWRWELKTLEERRKKLTEALERLGAAV